MSVEASSLPLCISKAAIDKLIIQPPQWSGGKKKRRCCQCCGRAEDDNVLIVSSYSLNRFGIHLDVDEKVEEGKQPQPGNKRCSIIDIRLCGPCAAELKVAIERKILGSVTLEIVRDHSVLSENSQRPLIKAYRLLATTPDNPQKRPYKDLRLKPELRNFGWSRRWILRNNPETGEPEYIPSDLRE